ncbi:beta-Ig-H3/fasciclin [Cladophialophora carrionii]|uniref:Beta-Ig-H3/fasciclin n=1 Tax=Cladophialophora carrionii TaxID=86049 RepID=A0A1C1CFE1_9EURO|nr:beta-Ig-H3/fasciclin [Cladophialophora carrionii]
MKLYSTIFATLSVIACCLAADQDILTILKQQNDISTFIALLEQFDDLVDILNQGTFSVLIPNDQALAAFGNENPDLSNDTDALRALLEYHIANGTHPSATFGLQPLFVPTLLTNPDYTNVTGGQVVEITSLDNRSAVVSGVKAVSHVVEADIFYLGGLIHIIDSVLTIPISSPATITKAGLTDLVALLNKGGFLTPSSPAATIVNSLADLTIFGPNSSQFSASFTGWEGLSSTDLLSILQYSISQGPVRYSSTFQSNTQVPTLDGISATMTEQDGQFYVDASLITTKDYLTSNGVLQILDRPTTSINSHIEPRGASGGLSTAAAAGIGIAIGAIILGGALVVALYMRTKRRRRFAEFTGGQTGDPPPRYELDAKGFHESATDASEVPRSQVIEIHHPTPPRSPLEIDGHERSRISVTIQGAPPRHLGFQARY